MVKYATVLTACAALAPGVSALGVARVYNNCPFPVTSWSVGSSVSQPVTLENGGKYEETFSRDPSSGGRAIKITKAPDGLYTGAPQTIFAYNLEGDSVWYDLSEIFGDDFKGNKLVVASSNRGCESIVWADGSPPAGSQVKKCSSDADVTLKLCA